jgi:hypothetical protein
MSRSRKEPKLPKWATRHATKRHIYFAEDNPPSGYRKMWRREARAIQNQALRQCRDIENLQVETKIHKLTYIYDWY